MCCFLHLRAIFTCQFLRAKMFQKSLKLMLQLSGIHALLSLHGAKNKQGD